MKTIKPKDFISIYCAVMAENGIKFFKFEDFTNAVKIMFASKDFKSLCNKLKLEQFLTDDFIDHPFTKRIDEDLGIMYFEISDEEIAKIFVEYDEESNLVTKAINKLAATIYIAKDTDGKIRIDSEDPDGEYYLTMVNEPLNECETRLYTDGKVSLTKLEPSEEMYSYIRTFNVEDSTYTIIVDYRNKQPLSAVIRSSNDYDYMMPIEEARKLLTGSTMAYTEEVKEKPRVYKLIKH